MARGKPRGSATTHEAHGRGPGGGRSLKPSNRRPSPPSLILTGASVRPSWPSKNLPEQRVALPKADTRRQVKADARLARMGGDAYLKRGRRDRRAAA